jgi:hypothetical protein
MMDMLACVLQHHCYIRATTTRSSLWILHIAPTEMEEYTTSSLSHILKEQPVPT